MKSFIVLILGVVLADYIHGELTDEERAHAHEALYNQSVGAFAGDMILTAGQKASLKARVAINNWAMRWTNNYMPYVIDNSLSNYRGVIQQAAQHIEQATGGCVKVRPWNGERNYVRLYYGNGCNSPIGMVGGVQDISLGQYCQPVGTIVHEMMHSLGFDHEQNRPDRDDYLVIYWNQIQNGLAYAFEKRTNWWVWTKFDFDSIMLYGNNAFSKDPKYSTMTAKADPNRWKHDIPATYHLENEIKTLTQHTSEKIPFQDQVPAPAPSQE